MAICTLASLAAACLLALPPAMAQPGSAPAPKGNGKVRVTMERTKSVYGYAYIVPEGSPTYTAECYDYEDYTTYECQQPCTTTTIDVNDYADASGRPTPNELTVTVRQCTSGEPECGGSEDNCETYEYSDYEYRYCPSTCYRACATADNAYEFAKNRKSGTIDFSVTLDECDNDYYYYGDDGDGDNPLVGSTLTSKAEVKCDKPDRSRDSCRYRTLGDKRDRYSYAYTYFQAYCTASDVPFVSLDGERTVYDYLSFGSVRYRNRG